MFMYDYVVGDSRDSIAIRYIETGTNSTSLPIGIYIMYYYHSFPHDHCEGCPFD